MKIVKAIIHSEWSAYIDTTIIAQKVEEITNDLSVCYFYFILFYALDTHTYITSPSN